MVRRLSSRESFATRVPLRRPVARELWDALRRPTTVIVRTADFAAADLTGVPQDAQTVHGVVADLEAATGDDGAYLLTNGASIQETHALLKKRSRVTDRITRVRFGDLDEDLAELERVKDTLDERIESRAALDSSFTEGWVPKSCTESIYGRARETYRDEDPDSSMGAATDTQQRPLPTGGE